jgi:hypothetical protein
MHYAYTDDRFFTKGLRNFYGAKKCPQNFVYVCNLQKKLPKINNHPMGEISPNLVTLIDSRISLRYMPSSVLPTFS